MPKLYGSLLASLFKCQCVLQLSIQFEYAFCISQFQCNPQFSLFGQKIRLEAQSIAIHIAVVLAGQPPFVH